MKKALLFTSLLVAFLATTFVSCKKEDAQKSRQELILGTWNIESTGVDADKNNILEPSESDSLDPLEIGRLVFKSDGTGISQFGRVGDASLGEELFRWTLSSDGQTLRVDQGFIFNHIVTQLTQNRLAYYFEENGQRYFEVFKR